MGKDIHYIKTFELIGFWESLQKSHEMMVRKLEDSSFNKKDFMRHNFFTEFGKELTINETKGMKCVRVYYDKYDDVVRIKAYDISGYIDLELNFDFCEKDTDENENEAEGSPAPKLDEDIPDVYTHTFEEKLFDARGAIARTPVDVPEVVVQQEKYVFHFKEIPACRWDIYIKDPDWLYLTLTGMDKRFYDLGYKSTEFTCKDVDGIINGASYMYYDTKGVFQRRVSICGTPWGGVLVYDEEVWEYDLRRNTATMIKTSMRKHALFRHHEYTLDEQGRLKDKKQYLRYREDRSLNINDESADGLTHERTRHYLYDKKGRLCEIKEILGGIGSAHSTFEYDEQGRLIRERNYGMYEELFTESIYEYITDSRVKVTMHMLMHNDKNEGGLEEQA